MPAQPRSRLQRAALVACVGTLIGPSPTVARNFRELTEMVGQFPERAWLIVGAAIIFGAILLTLPLFSLALFREQGSIAISDRNRKLANGTALLAISLLAIRAVEWLVDVRIVPSPIGPADRLANLLMEPLALVGVVIGEASILSSILLLRALGTPQTDGKGRVSTFLSVSAKGAVAAWGLVVLAGTFRFAILPYAYSTGSEQMARLPNPPTLIQMYGEPVETLLSFVVLFVAPWVVMRSIRVAEPGAISAQTPLPD